MNYTSKYAFIPTGIHYFINLVQTALRLLSTFTKLEYLVL